MPRYNRSTNPSCDNNTTGWVGFTGGTQTACTRATGQVVADTGKTTAGTFAIGSGAYSNALSCGQATASAGQTWTVVAHVYLPAARQIAPSITRFNGTTLLGTTATQSTRTIPSATWTVVRFTFSTGTGTFTNIRLHLDFPSDGTAQTVRVAAVRFEQINDPALVFADGSTGGQWSWDGTPGNSTSTQSDSINASPAAGLAATAVAAADDSAVAVTASPEPANIPTAAVDVTAALTAAPDLAVTEHEAVAGEVVFDAANPTATPAVVEGAADDAVVYTVAFTQTSPPAATTAVAAPAAAAPTRAAAAAGHTTIFGVAYDPDAATVVRPLHAPVTPTARPPAVTTVAVADVFPSPAETGWDTSGADASALYRAHPTPATLLLRGFGGLIPRGNLALFNLDATATAPDGPEVSSVTVSDVDATATVPSLDADTVVDEVAAVAVVHTLDADTDTRGT